MFTSPMHPDVWTFLDAASRHEDPAISTPALALLKVQADSNLNLAGLDARAVKRWWAGYYQHGQAPTISDTAWLNWTQICIIIANVRD